MRISAPLLLVVMLVARTVSAETVGPESAPDPGPGPSAPATPAPAMRDRPARAETRTWLYRDNTGVTVSTTATNVEHPLPKGWLVTGGVLADWISVERKQLDPVDGGGGQNSGHQSHGPDVVTSASPNAGGGRAAREWRWEGRAGVGLDREVRGVPARGRVTVKASREPDYRSFSGLVRGEAEPLERNVTVGGFVGYGYDEIRPHEAPAGQAADWPAAHARLNLGASVSQLLSPRAVAGVAATATVQRGMLANPYRRAIVVTTLFPENVPESRDRFTATANASVHLGRGTALHLRQGVYWDTWEVFAFSPSIELARELTDAGLLSVRARWTRQERASFYEPHYHTILPRMSGDPRLGSLDEHAAGLTLRWRVHRAPRRWLETHLVGSYELSRVHYRQLPTDATVGHLGSASLLMSY